MYYQLIKHIILIITNIHLQIHDFNLRICPYLAISNPLTTNLHNHHKKTLQKTIKSSETPNHQIGKTSSLTCTQSSNKAAINTLMNINTNHQLSLLPPPIESNNNLEQNPFPTNKCTHGEINTYTSSLLYKPQNPIKSDPKHPSPCFGTH